MKTIKKQIRIISLTLSVLLFFQSCKVYKQNPVTLEEALKENRPAKVETSTGETLKFLSIVSEGNQFFGVKKKKGDLTKTPINTDNIESIRLLDKTASTLLTALIPISLITAGVIIYDTYCCFSFGSGSDY